MSYIKQYIELCNQAGLNPNAGYHHEIAIQVDQQRKRDEAAYLLKCFHELEQKVTKVFGYAPVIALQVTNLDPSLVMDLQKGEDLCIRRHYPLPFSETEATFLYATPQEGLYLESKPLEGAAA